MTKKSFTIGVLLAAVIGQGAAAADFSDPTWPCIQRKVEDLSIGLMWPYPVEETELSSETKAAVKDLAARFTLRRVALEDMAAPLAAFTQDHGHDPILLGQVFDETFTKMAQQRKAIIKGIEDYSLKQIALADRIDATRTDMNRLMQADQPDFDKVDAMEEQLAWDERIYTDRRQALTYVCESPVLLEKRLYAVAQMLAAAVAE